MTERDDYLRFVAELKAATGLGAEFIAATQAYTDDLVETPECFVHVERRESPIHGLGLFATRHIPAEMRIAPARIGWQRAVAGRWTNHSHQPNAYFSIEEDGDLDLRALDDIEPGEEVVIDYRQFLTVNSISETVE